MNRRLFLLVGVTLLKAFVLSLALVAAFSATVTVAADAIPYPTVGTPNSAVYSFTAAATGHIVAYFAGSTASYDNELGLLVNGVSTGVIGLDNHRSFLGQDLDLGPANAGDSLTFVLQNNSLGMDAYSDPALNVSYDSDGSNGHQHVYSTPYTATSPIIDACPAGTFVAFEDLQYPASNFDYNDEDFIFTILILAETATVTPEPSTLIIWSLLGGLGITVGWWRRRAR
jgi:hypothetical protein